MILLVTFIQRFVTETKLSLIFSKTLLFPHKTAYFLNNSHNAYKNADSNSKFNITKLNRAVKSLRIDYLKISGNSKRWKLKSVLFQPTNARSKPRISSSRSFSTVTKLACCNTSTISICILASFFFKDFFKASKEQNEI